MIYRTNLRSSRAAGRFAQLKDPDMVKARPYWRYGHSPYVQNPRPDHLEWDGLILRHDDPWWNTHYPPNGWGCECSVSPVSKRQMKKHQWTVDRAPKTEWVEKHVRGRGTIKVPKGIDPGWAYTPGRSWAVSQTPRPAPPGRKYTPVLAAAVGASAAAAALRAGPLPPLPRRRVSKKMVLPKGESEEFYVSAFLKEFGIDDLKGSANIDDRTGRGKKIVITDAFFIRKRGNRFKIIDEGREQYVLLYADTIKDPEEIWGAFREWTYKGKKRKELRRYYLARYEIIEDGKKVDAFVAFSVGKSGWTGATAFNPDDPAYLDDHRKGTLLYRRGAK